MFALLSGAITFGGGEGLLEVLQQNYDAEEPYRSGVFSSKAQQRQAQAKTKLKLIKNRMIRLYSNLFGSIPSDSTMISDKKLAINIESTVFGS